MKPVFVLVHSPLPGPSTWSPVAGQLTSAEYRARLPLAYFEQDVPVPDGWDDHPCSYLLFAWHGCPAGI